jgi:hypothetical protein
MKHPERVWITALVLGWSFDFLFWKHQLGINFAIYTMLCLSGGFVILTLESIKPSWKSMFLLIPIIFFAVMSFVRLEPLSIFLAYNFTLIALSILALTYRSGHYYKYSLIDFITRYIKLAESMLIDPIKFYSNIRNQAKNNTNSQSLLKPMKDRSLVLAIVRGLMIAIPVVTLFFALLGSADLVFAQHLASISFFPLAEKPGHGSHPGCLCRVYSCRK